MASINGIQLKGVKKFLGHEEEPCFQGNLYVSGKKIGSWSQDSWGAVLDNVCLDAGYSERKLREKIIKLNEDKAIHGISQTGSPYTVEYDIEMLATDLLQLMDDEKTFKKAIKKGWAGLFVMTDGFHVESVCLPKAYLHLSDEAAFEKLKDIIEEGSKTMFKNKEIKKTIYRSLDDFNIGTPITLADIMK